MRLPLFDALRDRAAELLICVGESVEGGDYRPVLRLTFAVIERRVGVGRRDPDRRAVSDSR
jgi:hypothetical protein